MGEAEAHVNQLVTGMINIYALWHPGETKHKWPCPQCCDVSVTWLKAMRVFFIMDCPLNPLLVYRLM